MWAVVFGSLARKHDCIVDGLRPAQAGDLARALPGVAAHMTRGRTLWVCWPKRTSATPCDLTLTSIRAMVSPYDLVDSKICAVDETWSGAAISKRRSPPRR